MRFRIFNCLNKKIKYFFDLFNCFNYLFYLESGYAKLKENENAGNYLTLFIVRKKRNALYLLK